MTKEDYNDGVRAEKINSLAKEVEEHKRDTNARMVEFETNQRSQQKILWMLIGAIFLVQSLPSIRDFMQ